VGDHRRPRRHFDDDSRPGRGTASMKQETL
jgi:hypothetical protein